MRHEERADGSALVSIVDSDEDTPILFKAAPHPGDALSLEFAPTTDGMAKTEADFLEDSRSAARRTSRTNASTAGREDGEKTREIGHGGLGGAKSRLGQSAVVRSESARDSHTQLTQKHHERLEWTSLRDRKTPREIPLPRSVSTELCIGELLFEQYLVERVVGNMGSSVCVKLRHARAGQRYLLKHLSKEASQKPGAVPQFYNGARAAMRLQSEHAVRTIDVGCLPSGLPYVITEAFPGSELREILRVRGAVPTTEAVDIILQAAHAVAEAHHGGFAHGTLSPSTLFLTQREDGVPLVKVLEFGTAETLRRDPLAIKLERWSQGTAIFSESLRLWDSLAYSAPEQIRASKETTHRSDIWALGAILHELVSGSPPFAAPNSVSLLAAIVADAPAPLGTLRPGVPRALERIVIRCLSKDPSARFASIAELAVALRPFASPEAALNVDRILRIERLDPRHASLSTRSAPVSARPAPKQDRGVLLRLAALLLVGLVLGAAAAGAWVARSHLAPLNRAVLGTARFTR